MTRGWPGRRRLARGPETLSAAPRYATQAAVLSGVVEQGVIFPKDETNFRCIHHVTSQSSLPSWLHTFASAGLSGRCCSPGTPSQLADSQGLTGYLVYPEGLLIQMDPSSIPSYSFHGAHMDITTLSSRAGLIVETHRVSSWSNPGILRGAPVHR